jgi:hypothetical protein
VDERTILVRDAYVTLRDGPMVEIRRRKGV